MGPQKKRHLRELNSLRWPRGAWVPNLTALMHILCESFPKKQLPRETSDIVHISYIHTKHVWPQPDGGSSPKPMAIDIKTPPDSNCLWTEFKNQKSMLCWLLSFLQGCCCFLFPWDEIHLDLPLLSQDVLKLSPKNLMPGSVSWLTV